MTLAASFRQTWRAARAAQTEGSALESPDVEPRLAALVARGRSAHPGLPVDDLVFVGHLARCVATSTDSAPLALAESLPVDDLYLACACVSGVPGAAAAFDRQCGERLRAALAAVVRSDDLRAEIEQHTRDVLLIGGEKRLPKLGEYRGQGPLSRWVGVVVQGLAISILRGDRAETRARDAAAREAPVPGARPESEFVKQQFRSAFEQALAEAIATLDPRAKVLLRLQLVRGVSVEKIGKMYGVSQSTASRWLAEARETIRDELDRVLRGQLDVPREEVASLAGLVASQLDLSMSRLLATAG